MPLMPLYFYVLLPVLDQFLTSAKLSRLTKVQIRINTFKKRDQEMFLIRHMQELQTPAKEQTNFSVAG